MFGGSAKSLSNTAVAAAEVIRTGNNTRLVVNRDNLISEHEIGMPGPALSFVVFTSE